MHEGYEYAGDDVHKHEDADVIEANLADLVGTNMGVSADDEEDEEEYEDDGDDTDANGNGDDDNDEDDNL